MRLKLRIILDANEDVFRDILINENDTLLALHQSIKAAFGLKGEEMASFYLSNEDWFQGSEIPMENIFEEEGGETMKSIRLKEVVAKKGSRMIYVYDFLNMWTFFCETVGLEKGEGDTVVAFSFGELPSQAPQKEQMDILMDDSATLDDLDEEEDDEYFDDDYDNFYY